MLSNITTESIIQQVEYWTFPNDCGNVDPEYLAHLNTPVVARDFDLIRNLTGYDTLDYLGFDEGAMIGVTYAALFPDRVGKMVLDGISINCSIF